jgi:hypothetical protein
LDIVGGADTVMVNWSTLGGQAPLEIVQASVALEPTIRPVTPDDGEEGLVMLAVPLTTDQSPLPTAGVLAARVVAV